MWPVAGTLALLVALLLLAPLVPQPVDVTGFRLRAYASHTLFFLLLAAFVAQLAPLWIVRTRWLLAVTGAAFVLVVLLNIARVPVASDASKIIFGTFAGLAFVRAIERPWWLLPIAICVPIADAWSVFSERGITKAVIERGQSDPEWIRWPTIATPIAGYDYDLFGRIGIVDILFLALFLGVAARWQMGLGRGVIAMSAALVATSVLVFEAVDVAVPALPMLCIAFVLVYAPALWRDARLAMRGS